MDGIVDYPVKDLILFDALENPKWRTKDAMCSSALKPDTTVEEMISEIMQHHRRWQKAKQENGYDEKLIEEVYDEFLLDFITHVNREEEHGFSTVEETKSVLRSRDLKGVTSIEEIETINLEKAYISLLGKINSEERASDYGLLEASLLKETHKLLLHDVPLPQDYTKPGNMSDKRRMTEFEGEVYEYQMPEDMENAVSNLLDKYNFLFDSYTKVEMKNIDAYYNFFKICAWLLFELLDLHPFSDGNGRLCRILCSYLLSKFTPFPTPIYNVWTSSSYHDFKKALVDARKSDKRRPCALTTMIIECSCCGWRRFFEELDARKKDKNSTLENGSLMTTSTVEE